MPPFQFFVPLAINIYKNSSCTSWKLSLETFWRKFTGVLASSSLRPESQPFPVPSFFHPLIGPVGDKDGDPLPLPSHFLGPRMEKQNEQNMRRLMTPSVVVTYL